MGGGGYALAFFANEKESLVELWSMTNYGTFVQSSLK